jgi:hypothetical protein
VSHPCTVQLVFGHLTAAISDIRTFPDRPSQEWQSRLQ